MSHHKTAGAIGVTSGCMVTVKQALSSWGEGDTDKTLSSWREGGADKTLSIAIGDRDPPETQQPLGPVHTQNETEYAQSLQALRP
jgi:hypothetical protein